MNGALRFANGLGALPGCHGPASSMPNQKPAIVSSDQAGGTRIMSPPGTRERLAAVGTDAAPEGSAVPRGGVAAGCGST